MFILFIGFHFDKILESGCYRTVDLVFKEPVSAVPDTTPFVLDFQ
jgi:hypothetical protein